MAAATHRQHDPAKPTSTLDFSKKTRKPHRLGRYETALRSFRILKGLTPEQVSSFMDSYIIYDLDWADEKMMVETLGPDYQHRVGECLQNYYGVLNHLCAIGELEKMYIPPALDLNASITANQILYEESIAEELHLPPNAKLLDLGCGRGRVAAHMTSMSGARVTGLNIDGDQIASAVAFNKQKRFQNEFLHADFNDLPLPLEDNQFDGFYQIQAFSLCKDIPALCKELHRVLKPGARLSLLDWASLDAYDPTDTHHQKLMRAIKPLIGAVGTPTPQSMIKALESAGFRMIKHDNASIDGLQAPLIESADGYFRTTRAALLGLVRIGLLPTHFRTLFNRLTQDCDAFIEADRARLITTSYRWVAEKPAEGDLEPTKTASPASSDTAVNAGTPPSEVDRPDPFPKKV
ncbi:hypothetical protein D0869_08611 [Hortaea werneckii]|uniref:Methyltransferase type 11 domain-containing protein n=1 Tax=Hortaea werneckii TaxID=91943 RepID=A0A3M6ZHC4_HORWE|nr:hypothetical protein KC324_g9111 [Hortaea werneckii]KAI7586238.1 hypothetical protein KC316_g5723 [Hortaea werneckii]RMX79027.1 hypothetical protein D0869_08611 [Hortaea werneckii]RMY14603.1 hypothetical protein D0868_01373 [Hortaea werneckii]